MQALYYAAYNAHHLHNTYDARQVALAQGLAPSTHAHFLTPATLTTSTGAHTLTPATQTITSHGSQDPVTSPSPDLHESGTSSHGWIETPARGRAVQDPSVRAGHAGHLTVSDPLANNQYFPLAEDLD